MFMVIGGGISVALPVLLWLLVGLTSSDATPRPMSVSEAIQRLREGTVPPTVQLTDLVVDCGAQRTLGEEVYAPGHDDAEHLVMVRIPERQSCESVARSPGGTMLAPRPRQLRKLKIPDSRSASVAMLSPRTEVSALGLLFPLLFVGFGVIAIISGLRQRRRLIAQWLEDDESLSQERSQGAEARGTRSVASGPADPILGVPARLDESFIRSFDRKRQFFRVARWVGVALAGCIMIPTLWLTIDRHQTWERGVLPAHVDIDGHVEDEVLFLLHHTEITVVYTDDTGNTHTGTVSNWSLLWEGDTRNATLRHRVSDPSKFMVSTIVEQTPGTLLLATLVSLMLGGLPWLDRRNTAGGLTERQVRALAADLHAVELRVTNRFREMDGGAEESMSEVFSFRVRGSSHCFDVTIGDVRPGPLFLDANEQWALGLHNPGTPEHVFLVRADLAPLARPRPRPTKVRARWRRRAEQRRAERREREQVPSERRAERREREQAPSERRARRRDHEQVPSERRARRDERE